jgi:hypothetical protein
MKTHAITFLRLLPYCLGLLSWFANSLFKQAIFPFEGGFYRGILELIFSLPDGGLERIVGLILGALVGASLLIISNFGWDQDKRNDWLFNYNVLAFLIMILELAGLLISVIFSFLSTFLLFTHALGVSEGLNDEKFLASFALLFWSLSLGLSIYHHGMFSGSYKQAGRNYS